MLVTYVVWNMETVGAYS